MSYKSTLRSCLVLAIALLTACGSDPNDRECSTNSDCLQANVPGQCLRSPASNAKWCAFDNSSCASGLSWGVLSGDDLAGECVLVDVDAGSQPDASTADASTGDASTVDSGTDAMSIDASPADASPADASSPVAWGVPELVPNVNTSSYEYDPAATADELELYITIGEFPFGGWLEVARRTSTSVPFGTPEAIPGVSATGGSSQGWPFVTADGLELWFAQFTTGDKFVLHVSTRASNSDAWGAPVALGIEGVAPSLTEDKLELYYIEGRAVSAPALFRRTRASTGDAWSEPETVEVPAGLYGDGASYKHAHVTPDGLGLLLSEPHPITSAVAVELWRTDRTTMWEASDIVTIPVFNLDTSIVNARWNHDVTKIYLDATRQNGLGGSDIYVSSKE